MIAGDIIDNIGNAFLEMSTIWRSSTS